MPIVRRTTQVYPIRPEITYCEEDPRAVCFREMQIGEFFRSTRPQEPGNPALYIRHSTSDYQAISLRSGSICAFKADDEVVRVKVRIKFMDAE